MTTIHATTIINAPVDVCFHLSLSIDLELSAAGQYAIKAVDGVTTGTLGFGQRVTWKTRQYRIWVTHTSEITHLEEPTYFQDSMVHGLFRSFRHDHFFRSLNLNSTEMRDELHFSLPTHLMGRIGERLLARRRLSQLLTTRNILIKQRAESKEF